MDASALEVQEAAAMAHPAALRSRYALYTTVMLDIRGLLTLIRLN